MFFICLRRERVKSCLKMHLKEEIEVGKCLCGRFSGKNRRCLCQHLHSLADVLWSFLHSLGWRRRNGCHTTISTNTSSVSISLFLRYHQAITSAVGAPSFVVQAPHSKPHAGRRVENSNCLSLHWSVFGSLPQPLERQELTPYKCWFLI